MKYVFIVGLPRTGTKLTRSILESSQNVCVRFCPETWYLGDLFRPGINKKIHQIGNMSDDRKVRELVDYVYTADIDRTYWTVLRSGELGIPKEELLKAFLASDRTERSFYDALLRLTAEARQGQQCTDERIVGDKMPGNLYHVPKLLEWFPEAKIVHTFRDPRAILASQYKRLVDDRMPGFMPRLAKPVYSMIVVLYVTVTWLYAINLDRRYSARYPGNYRLFKYEDLVQNSEATVKELCNHIGIPFEHEMLAPADKGSSFNDARKVGFNQEAIEQWRRYLKPWMRTWLSLFGGRFIRRFGYPTQ